MVDINLIGDDQDQFDEDNEKEFRENYNSESNDFDQGSYMKEGAMDNQDYTKVIRRGGSKAGVYILFIIVIVLLAVTAYILFKPAKTSDITQPDQQLITETQFDEDTARVDESQMDQFDSSQALDTISPELRAKVIQSQVGITTIEQIVNTIPANVDFTMITYSDGVFLSELLASRSSDIDNVNSLLEQKLSSADVKVLSRDTRNVSGKQYYQALINGTLNQDEMSGATSTAQPPMFLSTEEFHQSLTAMCQESNLTVKQFDTAIEKNVGGLIIQPIKFRAFGLKANATSILNQILSENMNISFSKISLIANDIDLSNPYVALVMNIELYKE